MSESKSEEHKGLIFNIQKFSLHDGPGIRTTVFMKGCPLRCEWCCNPESQNNYPEVMTLDIKCIMCGNCIKACPKGAISVVDGMRNINRGKCDECQKCAEVCPSEGIATSGRYYSCDELMKEIEKDRVFYKNSGGGVTFSGGESLAQWEFLLTMLQLCKAKRIHTCLDTTGYAFWGILEKVLPYVDLILYDLKHLDDECHRKRTGVSNRLILENLAKVAETKRVWLRFPLIPGYNDSEDHIKQIGELAKSLGVEKVTVFPYHRLGETKYSRMGRVYLAESVLTPTDEDMEKQKEYLQNYGLEVSIGR